MDIMRRIGTNRDQRRASADRIADLDAELPTLVRAAFDEGRTWQELADLLGVGKARVYQIRDGRR